MSVNEDFFDINKVLMTVFSSLDELGEEKGIELIYEMNKTIPREFRGDSAVLIRLLTKVLNFVFEHSDKKEILLSLDAPEDFLYEELITFQIEESNIPAEKIKSFFSNEVKNELLSLHAESIKSNTIQFSIPSIVKELGYRRHYRLPDVSMVGKKLLLISDNDKVRKSISKMFSYFKYEVVDGYEDFLKGVYPFNEYDIVVIEHKLVTSEFEEAIYTIQSEKTVKYVLLRSKNNMREDISRKISKDLLKPATQVGVFELIISLFNDVDIEKWPHMVQDEKVGVERIFEIKEGDKSPDSKDKIKEIIEEKKKQYTPILDKDIGMKRAQELGETYADNLKNFLDDFEQSDLYFRQIIYQKDMEEIRDFCIDLEASSQKIGALSMIKFTESMYLVLKHKKFDMLPIYPGRFHQELKSILKEGREYLGIYV